MKIAMINPAKTNSLFLEELEEAAKRVIRSGSYILGPEVDAFEENCAKYLGAKHAIGVSSGTDALLVSLMAAGIGAGDEVICPSFTFFATAGSISRVGAKPVFIDNHYGCFTCKPCDIEGAITERTKAIIPVHLFGQSADMDAIMEIAKKNSLFVLEDVAQAIGAECGGKNLGTIGDAGCFSFFPSKNLGGFGDAGLVTTNDDDLAGRIKMMRSHGSHERYKHIEVGGNFRIDTLQAALLDVKLKYLPEHERLRIENSQLYTSRLADAGVAALSTDVTARDATYVLPAVERGKHVYNQFTLRVNGGKREELKSYLETRGIGCAVYYPIPLHKQMAFSNVVPKELCLPEADRSAEEALSLPIANEVSKDEISYICDTLINFASS